MFKAFCCRSVRALRGAMLSAALFSSAALMTTIGCQNPDNLGGKSSDMLDAGDNRFVAVAANSNDTEIQASRLALQTSQDPQIRKYAQMMVDDHGQASTQMTKLMSQKGGSAPTQLDTLHQTMVDNLKNKSGSDFDRAYAQTMVTSHQDTIKEFKKEADSGTDPDLRAKAKQLLPTLQMHLQMAQQLPGAM